MCEHRRIKKNYPHGKKSKPMIKCKDCGKIITAKDLADKKRTLKKEKRRRR